MKNTSITFRVSEGEKARLEELAKERDIPVSQLIREIVKEYFMNKQNK